MISLAILGAAFAFTAFTRAGVLAPQWNVALLGIGAASLGYWLRTRREELAPPLEWWLGWPLLALVVYTAVQLAPLPLWALEALSPARAQPVKDLEPVAGAIRYAPLSVAPMATLAHLLRMAGYAAVFLLVRELVWRFRERPWWLAVPIVAVAAAEAALGLVQHFMDPAGATIATGTYGNRNHFAGLLEMALPFAVMGAVAVFQGGRGEREAPMAPAL